MSFIYSLINCHVSLWEWSKGTHQGDGSHGLDIYAPVLEMNRAVGGARDGGANLDIETAALEDIDAMSCSTHGESSR